MKYKKLKNNKLDQGFTLVETLVAISIFSVSLIGVMSVLASGVSDTGYAKQKISATYLAQEGIEHARNVRDTEVISAISTGYTSQDGWNNFKIGLPSTPKRESDYYEIDNPDFSGFTRTIRADATSFGDDEVQIFSEVSWTQGSGEHSVTFSEYLFNWVE